MFYPILVVADLRSERGRLDGRTNGWMDVMRVKFVEVENTNQKLTRPTSKDLVVDQIPSLRLQLPCEPSSKKSKATLSEAVYCQRESLTSVESSDLHFLKSFKILKTAYVAC